MSFGHAQRSSGQSLEPSHDDLDGHSHELDENSRDRSAFSKALDRLPRSLKRCFAAVSFSFARRKAQRSSLEVIHKSPLICRRSNEDTSPRGEVGDVAIQQKPRDTPLQDKTHEVDTDFITKDLETHQVDMDFITKDLENISPTAGTMTETGTDTASSAFTTYPVGEPEKMCLLEINHADQDSKPTSLDSSAETIVQQVHATLEPKPATFTMFPRLPPELRIRVWNKILEDWHATCTPRLVNEMSRGGKFPLIIHVCQEARQETLRHGRFCLTHWSEDQCAYTFVNYEKDLVSIPDSFITFGHFYRFSSPVAGTNPILVPALEANRNQFSNILALCRTSMLYTVEGSVLEGSFQEVAKFG